MGREAVSRPRMPQRSPARRAGFGPGAGRVRAVEVPRLVGRPRLEVPLRFGAAETRDGAGASPTGAAAARGAANGLRPGRDARRGRRGRETGGGKSRGRRTSVRLRRKAQSSWSRDRRIDLGRSRGRASAWRIGRQGPARRPRVRTAERHVTDGLRSGRRGVRRGRGAGIGWVLERARALLRRRTCSGRGPDQPRGVSGYRSSTQRGASSGAAGGRPEPGTPSGQADGTQVDANAEAFGPYPEATAGFTACFAWKDQVVWCNG